MLQNGGSSQEAVTRAITILEVDKQVVGLQLTIHLNSG